MKKIKTIINKINIMFKEAYRNNSYTGLDLDNENIILNGLKMNTKVKNDVIIKNKKEKLVS